MKKILIWGVCACLPFMANSQSKSFKNKNKRVNTLQKIKNSSEIVVAVRENEFPFSYLDESGNARGYNVELCESVIKEIRKDLDIPRLKVIYFPVKESETDSLFKRNLINLDCGNAPVSNKRAVSFSNSILAVEARILASQTSTAKSLADFNNQVVAVLKGSSLEQLLNDYIRTGTYFYRLRTVNSIDEALQSMKNGNAKAFVNDDITLLSILASNKELNDTFKITGFPISSRKYAFTLPQGDKDFEKLINKNLRKKLDDGEIHKIYEKWFLLPIPPTNVNLDFGMSKSTRDLLNNME